MINGIENIKGVPVDVAASEFGKHGNAATKNAEYLQIIADDSIARYKEEKLAEALFDAFKLDDPAINMVHRPHYSPKTTLDGKFNLREIAAQAIKCLDDLS